MYISFLLADSKYSPLCFAGARFFAKFKNSFGTKGETGRWWQKKIARKKKDETRPGKDTL